MAQRDYEVSIWTLQDEFITLLKPSHIEDKGQPQKGKITLKTDQTQELTLSIPKFIREQGVRIVNPIWENVTNGTIVKNLRKVKVIFNKQTNDEAVLEFVIIDTKENHEGDKVFCDIKCEGLAFHELGKRGYKISLSTDLFELEDWQSFEASEPAPKATIQYWNDKFLTAWSSVEEHDPNVWYYDVQMDWSSYGTSRDSDKIYEEEYTESWDVDENDYTSSPASVALAKEKERMINEEESNIYNITQKIAEAFQVFCRYEYGYDQNYHIISRKVIYYNNFNIESLGYLDLIYPYSASKISRQYDGKDVTTKMFVKPAELANAAGDEVTIINVQANKSLEDYLLNFDYMREIGGITEEQYEEIEKYENHLHILNTDIANLDNQLIILEGQLPELRAKLTIANNAVSLDKDRISATNDLLNALDVKDGDEDGAITISSGKPETALMLLDKENTQYESYYIKLTQQGIKPDTLRLFRTLSYGNGDRLTDEITTGQIMYDEYGQVSGVKNLIADENDRKIVYITYTYVPQLYYDSVRQTWERRLAKDTADQTSYTSQIEEMEETIETLMSERADKQAEKATLINKFENMMGPALRESYWQPEDYKDSGDRFIDTFMWANAAQLRVQGESNHAENFWDTELFDGEQNITYEMGADQGKKYYPCINLSNHMDFVSNHLNDLSFVYYDYTREEQEEPDIRNLRIFTIGSTAQYGFIKRHAPALNNNNEQVVIDDVIPVLIITGIDGLSDDSLARMVDFQNNYKQRLTVVSTELEENNNKPTGVKVTITYSENLSSSDFITTGNEEEVSDDIVVVYPRIKIDTLALKIGDDNLSLKREDTILKNYEDYYVLTRGQDYYITIKPIHLVQTNLWDYLTEARIDYAVIGLSILANNSSQESVAAAPPFSLRFTISNADIAIYLDAKQILKENAYPRVAYEVTPSMFDESFMYTAYKQLNRIVNINDTDLQLRNAQGYISSLELDLDKPQNDRIEIKNYKNKFEDLFSSIVAQTEAMKSSAHTIELAASAINNDGTLSGEALQDTLRRVDLDYAFNDGKLTITEADGIWGTSDSGVVAMRGGGIFTATQKDPDGNWIWNTGIVPQGINADIITTGQLDTNRIRIYAGDKVRLQMNGDGLFAYKSIWDDPDLMAAAAIEPEDESEENPIRAALNNNPNNDIDKNQYVVHNENGLFLVAKKGSYILNESKDNLRILDKDIERVAISWNGLTLRNWNGKQVFNADPNTGNLEIEGKITATSGEFHGDIYASSFRLYSNEQDTTGRTIDAIVNGAISDANISGQIDTAISQHAIHSVEIIGEDVFKQDNGGTITPQSITLTVETQNISVSGEWLYKDSNDEDYQSFSPRRTDSTLTINSSGVYWNNNRATFKYQVEENGTTYYDIKTIYLVSDGQNGASGQNGVSPTIYELEVSTPVVVKSSTDASYSPTNVVLSAKQKTGNDNYQNYNGIFKINNTILNNTASSSFSYSINSGDIGDKITFDLYDSTGTNLLDSQSVTIIGDGAKGDTGASGTSPYNVILTNENCSFPSGAAGSASCEVLVYQGSATVNAVISWDQSDVPAGMSISLDNNNSQQLNITTTSVFASSGNLPINIVADSQTFIMYLTYSVVGVGAQGPQGPAGEDAYTVFLTNENHGFSADPNGKLFNTTVTIQAKVYKGTELQTGTLISCSNNTAFGNRIITTGDTAQISITTANPLTLSVDSGTIDFTVTCGTTSFMRTFSYQINKEPDEIINSRQLYYLKSTSGTAPSEVTASTSINDTDAADGWKTIIPTYQTGGTYYTCTEYTWKSEGKTWDAPRTDARINTALAAAATVKTFTDNGVQSDVEFGNKTYAVALTSNKGLLIGANNGLTIVNSDEDGSAITMDAGRLSLYGPNLSLSAGSNITLSGGSISLSTNNDNIDSSITLNSGAINLTRIEGSQSPYSKQQFSIDSIGLRLIYSTENYNTTEEQYEYNDTAKIIMNQNGLSLSGNNIEINGQPIWSHENIIIMSREADSTSEPWRKSITTIENYMMNGTTTINGTTYDRPDGPSSGDWVLIEPIYTTEIIYETENQSTSTMTDHVLSCIPQNPLAFLGGQDGSDDIYQYIIECTVSVSYVSQQSSNYFRFILSNSDISYNSSTYNYDYDTGLSNDTSAFDSLSNTNYYSCLPARADIGTYYAVTFENSTVNKIYKVKIVSKLTNRNLCEENKTLYLHIRNCTGNANFSITNVQITAKSIAETQFTRVPCNVYYYPIDQSSGE